MSGKEIVTVDQNLLGKALVRLAGLEESEPPTKTSLIADPEFVEKASYVIARLEHVQYERQQASVFDPKLRFVKLHCNEVMKGLLPEDIAKTFDIDVWFAMKRNMGLLPYDPQNPLTDTRFVQYDGRMTIDWLNVLIEQECETPGFTKVLYNCLTLEENVQNKIHDRRRAVMPQLQGGGQYY